MRTGWGSSAAVLTKEIARLAGCITSEDGRSPPIGEIPIGFRFDANFSHVLPRDQPGAPLVGDIRPQPIDRDRQAVAEADQEIDVRHAPGEPREATGKPQPAEVLLAQLRREP